MDNSRIVADRSTVPVKVLNPFDFKSSLWRKGKEYESSDEKYVRCDSNNQTSQVHSNFHFIFINHCNFSVTIGQWSVLIATVNGIFLVNI
jgi:hypothetical protein